MSTTPPAKPRQTVALLSKQLQASEAKQASTTMMLGIAQESIADLKLAIEDRGWAKYGNSYEVGENEISLEDLKKVSKVLRPWIIAGGILKKIIETRGDLFYGDGIGFNKMGRAKKAFESPVNRSKLFSAQALQEINRSHGTDSLVIFLVHKQSKEILRYALDGMGNPFLDSEDKERAWFVRREFTRITPQHPEGEPVDEYYPTDLCPASEDGHPSIKQRDGAVIPINRDYTAVVWDVNRQVGSPFGIPDLFASLQWAEKYTEYLKDQSKFAKALAAIAWQYKTDTADQAKRTAAVVRDAAPVPAGSSDVSTGSMQATPMSGASAVSFENGAPLAAQAAVAAGLTKEDVLGDAQTGNGSAIDPSVRKVIKARRDQAADIFKRVGKLLGAPNLEVIFTDIESESPFREAQMIIDAWNTGNFAPDEIRPALAQRIRIPIAEGSKSPVGVVVPNNQKQLDDAAAAAAANKPDPADDGTNKQGKDGHGVGKLSDGKDGNEARDKGEVAS